MYCTEIQQCVNNKSCLVYISPLPVVVSLVGGTVVGRAVVAGAVVGGGVVGGPVVGGSVVGLPGCSLRQGFRQGFRQG